MLPCKTHMRDIGIGHCHCQGYVTADVADAEGLHRLNLSGTKFRQLLRCAPALCATLACSANTTARVVWSTCD
jgi:hypothetical protein